MLAYLRLEALRMLRNPAYLFFTLALPIGIYLLFTSMFGGGGGSTMQGVPYDTGFMVSMAAFGAIGAALHATGPRIADERSRGWLRQLRVTPLPARKVIAAKVLAAIALAGPAVILVSIAGVLAYGVTLAAWQWAAMFALLWLGALPFAALGVLIGYLLKNVDAAQAATTAVYLPLAVLGGLWMPVQVLPEALQRVAHALPSNRYAELGWQVAGGQAPTPTTGLILLGWTAAFAATAAYGYRRSNAAG